MQGMRGSIREASGGEVERTSARSSRKPAAGVSDALTTLLMSSFCGCDLASWLGEPLVGERPRFACELAQASEPEVPPVHRFFYMPL